MKLVQKRFLKGSREFEIAGDAVQVRIRTARRQETLTVMLAVLNPEPVINGPFLEFHSRVNGEALLSLWLNKPDAATFNAWVELLKRSAREQYNAFAGLNAGAQAQGLAANSYAEPPDFESPGVKRPTPKAVNPDSIDSSIKMLEQHLGSEQIEKLLQSLQALKTEPGNEQRLAQLVQAFDGLGSRQGAVLTYAPYIGVLLSDNPFAYSQTPEKSS